MDAHKNFAWSTVATAPSPAASGTSLVVASGEGAVFPAVPFNAVVCPAGTQPTAANAEVIRVTARTTDTFTTIVRAQEGTGARTIVVGDQVFAAVTALTLTDVEAGTWLLPIDRQTFTATGAFTWTKPAGARVVRVRLVSGGGGAGAGRRGAAGAVRCGGGGGPGGTYVEAWYAAADLGATVAGSVGSGGAGGVAQTVDSTDGASGSVSGTTSTFGTILKALNPTSAGGGGTATAGVGGISANGLNATSQGGGGAASGSGGAGATATAHEGLSLIMCGGAAGGGITTGDVEAAGGAGRANKNTADTNVQTAGTAGGGSATPVASPKTLADLANGLIPFYGGAGGGASKTTAAGAGGTGQGYGAGGGGGGSSLNTFASGAGGAGAPGVCIVESYG